MKLDIEDYNSAEAQEIFQCGYSELAAFSTKTFDDHCFPTRILDERELFRYADMFVGVDLNFLERGKFQSGSSTLSEYTIEEISLLTKISKGVELITENSFSGPIQVYFNHLSAVGLFRVVQTISSFLGRPLTIFEIGPGCGYTGVLLGMTGHNYISYDVTQAYYLWQNRLYAHFFQDEFVENALLEETELRRVSHIPWWHYMKFRENPPFEADLILSNSNLGEMHWLCLRYSLRLSEILLRRSDVGMLLYSSLGAQHINSKETVTEQLIASGFSQKLEKYVKGWTTSETKLPDEIMLTLQNGIPLYDPQKFGKTFEASDFIDFSVAKMPEEYRFYNFATTRVGG